MKEQIEKEAAEEAALAEQEAANPQPQTLTPEQAPTE